MARRPTQRIKMWSRDAIVLEDTTGQDMRTLIPPPLGPEPKGLSQRHLRDLIPKAFVIQLGHPEKQGHPCFMGHSVTKTTHTMGVTWRQGQG